MYAYLQVAVFIDYFVTLLTKWKFNTIHSCIFYRVIDWVIYWQAVQCQADSL